MKKGDIAFLPIDLFKNKSYMTKHVYFIKCNISLRILFNIKVTSLKYFLIAYLYITYSKKTVELEEKNACKDNSNNKKKKK